MDSATKVYLLFSGKLWTNKDYPYICHNGLFPRWWNSFYGMPENYCNGLSNISCYITSHRWDKIL